MSFAENLLDGFDLLYKRTDGVLKSCNEFAAFYKTLAKVEREYGKTLAKVASTQKKDLQKAHASSKEVGSTLSVWETILTELEKTAESHNQLADKLENELVKNITNHVKEKTKVKKKLETDGAKLTKDWKAQLENLNRARGKYVALSKEAESLEMAHQKAKTDPTVKPNQLAKYASKSQQGAEKANQADGEYRAVLTTTNQKQVEYYCSTMPALLREFQEFEEDRIRYMKQTTETFAAYNGEKPAVYSSCCEAIISAAQSISVEADIQAYVTENSTGISPPEDIEHIPYDTEASAQSPKGPAPARANKSMTKNPSAYSGKIGKYNRGSDGDSVANREWGLSDSDYNSLSPQEQQSKLEGQLEEIEKALNMEAKTKEGLENLVRFYGSDPVAQKKAEEQLNECDTKLRKLQDAQYKVSSQLQQSGGNDGYSPAAASNGGGGGRARAEGLYDYAATNDTELSFSQGDILTITEQDDSGWWYAELNGASGFVPNNYVKLI